MQTKRLQWPIAMNWFGFQSIPYIANFTKQNVIVAIDASVFDDIHFIVYVTSNLNLNRKKTFAEEREKKTIDLMITVQFEEGEESIACNCDKNATDLVVANFKFDVSMFG